MKDKLERALQRNFSAIVFDIDGVLTEHSNDLSPQILKSIVNILNKKVYVSIVSGRARYISKEDQAKGIKSIDDVFKQITACQSLNNKNNLKYLLGYEQNGAAVFGAFNDDNSEKIATILNHTAMDKSLQKNIVNSLASSNDPIFNDIELKTHSMALWLNRKHKTGSHKVTAQKALENILSDYGVRDQYRFFQTSTTIDINKVGVSKAVAVDFYIKAGLTLEQIARVGDSTYTGGNDSPMVQYNGIGDDGGFSVQHYNELDGFPIISLPKAINMEGTRATQWLLNNIRFNEGQPLLFN